MYPSFLSLLKIVWYGYGLRNRWIEDETKIKLFYLS